MRPHPGNHLAGLDLAAIAAPFRNPIAASKTRPHAGGGLP